MTATRRQQPNGSSPHAGTLEVRNPVTGALVGSVVNHTREDVQAAVARARYAQRLWAARTVRSRMEILTRARDRLWHNQHEAMAVIRAETGKTDAGAFLEVYGVDGTITWLANHAERHLRRQRRLGGVPLIQYARVYYKPHGVAGFIVPWNYPLALSYLDALPALAAGNTVIIKPSELTPFSALHMAHLLYDAGLPQDVLQVVTGDASTGSALVDEVDYICFTGSTASGRKVAVQAAERLIPYTLELGGKDAMIVCKDADLDLAASGALAGGLENAGQMCVSIERVYVEAPIYDQFVERVRHYAQQVIVGAGNGFDVHVGSLTNERELLRVERHVADALAKGAKLLCGGVRRPDIGPLFYEPAILIDVDHTMDVMREETFGPVVPIMKVADVEEAVRLANDCEYGLSGSVFTRDLRKGEHIATRLNTGDVVVNRTPPMTVAAWGVPWGGQKQSGTGRRGGKEGLLRFVTTQTILVDQRWEALPAVTAADPLTVTAGRVLRWVRQVVPFV